MSANFPSRIERDEIVESIGQGGMGTLFLARHPALNRLVAIKVLTVRNPERLAMPGANVDSIVGALLGPPQ